MWPRRMVVAALAPLTLFLACAESSTPSENNPPPAAVAVVDVTPAIASFDLDSDLVLTAVPRDAQGNALSGRAITWTSSNPALQVSSTGLVTATDEVSARITATAGGVSGGADVTAFGVASTVDVTAAGRDTIPVGTSMQLTATVRTHRGRALRRGVTWSSGDSQIVSVSASGLVTGVAPGSADITATEIPSAGDSLDSVAFSNGRAYGKLKITVIQATIGSASLAPNAVNLSAGGTQQLTLTAYDSYGNVLTGLSATWTTTASGVATVSGNGMVTAVAPGSATITATVSGVSATASATVTASTPTVATITLTPAPVLVTAGQSTLVTATLKDASGNVVPGTVSWASSNSAVATVSPSSSSSTTTVSGVAAGSALISATVGSVVVKDSVTVAPVPVASVTISPPSASLAVGATQQLSATLKDASGNVLTGRAVTWSTNNPAAATVSASGFVTAVAAGSAIITATSGGQSGAANVTVTASTPSGVMLYPGDNLQSKVSSYPTGTAFVLTPGTYHSQTIVPRDGMTFTGMSGAIMDGDGVTYYAIGTPSSLSHNVVVQGITVQNYHPGNLAYGAVGNDGAINWVIRGNEVRNNAGAGIRVVAGTRVVGNYVHHNAVMGLSVYKASGALIDSNEVAYNGFAPVDTDPATATKAGMKVFNTQTITVRGNYFHDNSSQALWFDTNCRYVLVEGNRVIANSNRGLFYEISYDAVIRNNYFANNQPTGGSNPSHGAIHVESSPNVEIYGNTVQNNGDGITAFQTNRGSGAYGPYELNNFYVHDNTIVMSVGQTGLIQLVNDTTYYTSRNNRYQNNTYFLGPNAGYFTWWNKTYLTETQWQAYGQDVTGTFNR